MDTPQQEPRYRRDFPSDRYLEMLLWCRQYHRRSKAFDGTRSFHAFPTLKALCQGYRPVDICDWGAGKGLHYGVPFTAEGVAYDSYEKAIGARFRPYDPAWEPHARPPTCADGVLCNDVLQYIPAADIPWVLDEILLLATDEYPSFVLLQVSTTQGKKRWGDPVDLAEGRPPGYWVREVEAAIARSPEDRGPEDLDVTLRIRGYNAAAGAKKCGLWRREGETRMKLIGEDNLTLVDGHLEATRPISGVAASG